MIELIRIIYLFILVIIAAYTDVAKDKVYNWLTLPSILLGPLLALSIGGIKQGDFNLLNSLLGMTLGGGIFLVFYLLRQMGGGDVKLMAAIGGLVGFPLIIKILFYSSLVGAVIGLIIILWHHQRLTKVFKNVLRLILMKPAPITQTKEVPLTIPFALAIALGTIWMYCLILA